jgi:ribonuclease BN (tRNA processing enzyme)
LAREGIDPNGISTICVTHLHGDHFSGLVWWLIHAMHVAKRTAPLTVSGPKGIEARFLTTAEALFPDCTTNPRRFDLRFVEYEERVPVAFGPVRVTAFEVRHPSGAPPYALRFEIDGKIVAFSGDTEWTESLVPAATGADLFICECYAFDSAARYHMNWRTIQGNLERLGAKRVLLTHMGLEMLARRGEVSDPRVLLAEDGLALEI